MRHPLQVDRQGLPGLSPREKQILELAARGLADRGIAHELGIAIQTVRVHLGEAYRKLGASGRVDAVMKGLRDGAIDIKKIYAEETEPKAVDEESN